ncbi:hypothetical protein ACSQ67_010189 [Phaseolus vulgaris]
MTDEDNPKASTVDHHHHHHHPLRRSHYPFHLHSMAPSKASPTTLLRPTHTPLSVFRNLFHRPAPSTPPLFRRTSRDTKQFPNSIDSVTGLTVILVFAYSMLAMIEVEGYAVAEGRPVRERRLGCCGLGCAWCLFILGFFLAGIPWYVGAIIMLCSRVDHREKPGYVACVVAAVLGTIAIIVGVTKGADDW